MEFEGPRLSCVKELSLYNSNKKLYAEYAVPFYANALKKLKGKEKARMWNKLGFEIKSELEKLSSKLKNQDRQ